MNALVDWWQARAPRERAILSVAGGAVALLLVYLIVVEPLQQRREMLERGVASQRELLSWMHRVVVPARGELRTGRTARGGGSLFSVVDRSAKATPLAGSLRRVQPEGDAAVRVWLEGAPFDEFVRWIAQLERDQGVSVSALAVERAEGAGLVGVRVTLERAP